jgi:hypothetical protein
MELWHELFEYDVMINISSSLPDNISTILTYFLGA